MHIEYAAEVTGAWATLDPGVLQALDPFHVWTPEYLENRCAGIHRTMPLSLQDKKSVKSRFNLPMSSWDLPGHKLHSVPSRGSACSATLAIHNWTGFGRDSGLNPHS